jgi:hypothetical protein
MHQFEKNLNVISALRAWKDFASAEHFVLVGLTLPAALPPHEMRQLWTTEEYALPDIAKMTRLLSEIDVGAGKNGKTVLEHLESKNKGSAALVADAGRGLTLEQFRSIMSRHLMTNTLDSGAIWNAKRTIINVDGFLEARMPEPKPASGFHLLGGMTGVKNYSRTLMKRWMDREVLEAPKGVVLLGPPGTGKSRFAYNLAGELGLPYLKVDLGKLFGGLVGDTERNTNTVLNLINALAPCVACFDELEKMTPSRGSGTLDSGVGNRMLSALLNWFSDRPSNGVFVVGCANDLDGVHPALLRAERFDGTFFVDIPSKEARELIWEQYQKAFKIPANMKRPESSEWSGSEIRACCRLAHTMGFSLEEASLRVAGIARSAPDLLPDMRKQANGKYLCAETGIIYTNQTNTPLPGKRRQHVQLDNKKFAEEEIETKDEHDDSDED